MTTVTIDGEHARDFDDAITIEKLPNGHYWLGVHIADVSHYVREGSALDGEALERATSVYFPERAVHMFPSELSTGLCSLNPNVDRLVQSCLMEVDKRGQVMRYELHDGVINSDARMTYTDVNKILTDKDPETIQKYLDLVPKFELMGELFTVLNGRRRRRGSIDFDLPEAEVVLDEKGRVEAILAAQRNIAHRLIEEFMLLANETVAHHLAETEYADDVPRPRGAGSVEGGGVRRVHRQVRALAERAAERGQAEALPEAGDEDQRHARGARHRGADAADDAEGALRHAESRALRTGGGQLYAFHVADSPVSGSGRASHAARAAACERERGEAGRA